MNSLKIFLTFFKVGVIGFGGGSALIPVVERELLGGRESAMEPEEYLKHTVIANITPGALPVKLGATCGYQLGGFWGSLAGSYGVMLPGVLLTVLLMALFSLLGTEAIHYFNYASVGITVFIVFLLMSYVVKTVRSGQRSVGLALCAGAFALTGGKEIRQIISQLTGAPLERLGTPLFDISTIDLMILTFFMILLLEKLKNKAELFGGLALCVLYAFCAGKTGVRIGAARYSGIILALMLALLLLAFLLRRVPGGKDKVAMSIPRGIWMTVGVFLLIPVLLTAAIALCGMLAGEHGPVAFMSNAALSTITSFGGGEAYVSVADGIFVQAGYVQPDLFYTRLVPIANALPGPILVKVVAGIAYLFGAAEGSAAAGWAMAAAAAATALGCCSAIAVLVMQVYDNIRHLGFIIHLKKYILPVICGMLLSTSCSMLFESMKITGEKGIAGFVSLPILLAGIFLLDFLHKKLHLHDLILLVGAAGVSLACLLLI